MMMTEPNPPTLARVFARRTNATPTDALAFYDEPPLYPPQVDEVHVSVTFTWDVPRAERLARAWKRIAPVTIGGPGTGMPGGEFTPGLYLKPGYVITSRGCPNKCWFCSVWRREGHEVRELPVTDGWNVLDDNLLACSPDHFAAVCAMLCRHRGRVRFTGGLEAARLTDYHAGELRELRPKALFMAYDTPDGWEPLRAATDTLLRAGFTTQSHVLACYVLIGYPRDTEAEARDRLEAVKSLGLTPYAMLWRDEQGQQLPEWSRLQRCYVRPSLIYGNKPATTAQKGLLL
jgi:hypothetical protein